MIPVSFLTLLGLSAPELFVLVGALAVLTIDMTVMRGLSRRVRSIIAISTATLPVVVSIAWSLLLARDGSWFDGVLVSDPFVRAAKIGLLIVALCALWCGLETLPSEQVGESVALGLFSLCGMMLMTATNDLAVLFVAMELASLSLYALLALQGDGPSTEAAFKYFVFGGIAAAFTLYGLTFLYGAAHSTSYATVAAVVARHADDPLIKTGIILTLFAFAFKVAVFPLHWWAPDAYQTSRGMTGAFIGGVSKVAGFIALGRLCFIALGGARGLVPFAGASPGWAGAVFLLAGASQIFGAMAGLAQTNLKRLLAYSAVAHAGYAMTALLGSDDASLRALLYYSVTYGVSVAGLFGLIAQLEAAGIEPTLEGFAGLYRRSRFAPIVLLILLLSLAGIPPLAGFFGKFFVFAAMLHTGVEFRPLLILLVVAIAGSTVSLYYYIQFLKRAFVEPGPENAPPLPMPLLVLLPLVVICALTVLLGVWPAFLPGFAAAN